MVCTLRVQIMFQQGIDMNLHWCGGFTYQDGLDFVQCVFWVGELESTNASESEQKVCDFNLSDFHSLLNGVFTWALIPPRLKTYPG